MKKLKKSLSVLLTFVMLFTTFCFFPLDLGAIEADAAIAGIKIVVPETIYLTPSTGASTTGQYYVNNNSDGSVKTAYDTTASVAVIYPGATLKSVSAATTVAANIGAITGLNGTTLGSGAATASSAITLGAGLNAGETALLEWTFVFDVNGQTRTHYAYSVAYAPWYQPVGAAAKAVGAHHNTYASSILWVSGVHGYTDGDSGNRHYVQTANFLPMFGTIKTPTNNNPDTNWIQSGSNGLSPTISYYVITESGTRYHARANSISPTAMLTVDTSRYNNFNQIPNFKIGFMVTDRDGSKSGTWYVSDYSTGTGASYYNGTDRGGSQYTSDYNDSGEKFSYNDNDNSAGVKYNGTWDKGISGTSNYRIKSAVKSLYSATITSSGWNNNFVNISVTGANKSTLRTKVMEGTSYAKENYTTDSWNAYKEALKAAATNLGNPASATVDTSALTTAESKLQTTAYFNANGGTLDFGFNSVNFDIGGASSVSFPQSTLIAAYPASRTGYTFLGWAKDKNATSAPDNLAVGFNETVYAVWQANSYDVAFDNLINVKNWSKSANNATISFNDDYSVITLTSNDGVGEGTSESPEFPVTAGKQYKIDIDFEGNNWDIYIFFRNATTGGTGIEFSDNATRRYSSNGSTGVDPENAVFTAPAGATKAVIRLDANGSNNTVKFKNVRVYEAGSGSDGASYKPVTAYKYDSTYGNALPTPTKTGYVFKGWVDENGNAVAADAKVDFVSTKHLYSTWEIGKYTITFDTDGGSAVSPITGNYGTAVTKPSDPTKTGYAFTGWDKEIPQTIPAENMTIKATWSENSYAVFFDGNGHTGGTAPSQINTTYTGTVTLPENTYTKAGYTFVGWNTKQDGSGVTYSANQQVSKLTAVRDGSVTLYAVWEETPYTITYVYDNGTGETKVVPFKITDVLVSLEAPTKTGYSFAGWKVTSAEGNWEINNVVGEGVTVPAGVMYGNVTLTAQWTANQYTITFDTDGGSAVNPITQDFGTAVEVPAAPTKTGYTFAGWSPEVPGTMPAENITIKANWTVNQYTITFDTDGGSAVSPITQDFGTAVEAPAAPTKTGYTFAGWSAEIPGIMPAENITIKANWTVNQYTITFNTDGGSAVSPITQDFGTAITAPAAPTKEGFTFVTWSPALPDTMPAENITLTAQWTIKLYDVTFKFFDKDGTEITVVRTDVPHGTEFSALQLPTANEGFIATYYNGSVAEPENNKNHYNFSAWGNTVNEITADITFEASYTEESHNYFDNGSVAADCTNTGLEAKECDCGYSYSKVTPALGHSWTETGRIENCTTNGTVDYKCSRCSETKQETIPAVGHKFSDVVAKQEPNCTEVGYEAYKTCTVCNLYFAVDADSLSEGSDTKTEIPANGHDYGELIDEIPATCEGTGVIAHYMCSVCSVTFDENKNAVTDLVIPAKGHGYGQWIAEVPADCENEGTKGHYHCDACDKNFDAEKNELADLVIPANGHDYGELIPEIPATCVATGTKAHYTCSVCSVSFDENKAVLDSLVIDINPDNHDLVSVDAKEPTCEGIGWDAYEYCQRQGCDHSTYVEKPAINHDYKGEVTIPVTCITNGEMTYTCDNDSTHTYIEAIVAEGHNFTNEVAYKAPTCTETGNEAYKQCSVCNKYFAAGEEAFSENAKDSEAAFVIKKNGHSYETVVTAPSCTENGYTTYTCSACGDNYKDNYVDKLGHTEGEVVIEEENPATCTEAGSYDEVVYCSVCGKELSRVEKTTPATGHTEATKQDNVIGATCTTPGSYDNVTYCSVCNAELGRTNVTGVTLPHTYTQQIIDEAHLKESATCTRYAVYYYDCADCTANAKDVDGETFEYVEGGYNAENHIGTTTTADEDIVAGTCKTEKTWNEVTRCDDCNEIITSVPKTGDVDKNNHIGETYKIDEDIVAGTCTTVKTWNEVTYCADCDTKLNSVAKTGEKDASNHSTTETVLKDYEAATCCEKGYSGNLHCADCDAVVKYGNVIDENAENHAGGTIVEKEDTVPGTCVVPETWNDVTYCVGCGEKLGTLAQTGDIDENNHDGETRIEKADEVAGTCETEATWTEITYCVDCGDEIGREDKTGEKDPANHTGETYTGKINEVAGTCETEATWTEITYCKGCDVELGRENKTGETDPENHTGETYIEKINEVAGTCETAATWTEVTYCKSCDVELGRTDKTGETDPENHTGETYIEKINEVAGTCETAATWTEVTYCEGCDVELGRENKTGETDPENHTGETYTKDENIVPGTCVSVKTWDEVTYCKGCDVKLGTVQKTGDKDESNHTGTPDKIVGYIAPTCKTEGYTGDTLYNCCDKLYAAGTAIPTVDHTPSEAVRENEIPATETADGSYESVVYCSVCGAEISRETVAVKLERTITFVMKDKTVEVKAYNGDTVDLPEVADFTGADGFIYKFKGWDKAVVVVNGDATYTAIYTEPADWSDLDSLEETLKEVLEGGLVDDSILEENKAQIEEVLNKIEAINKERNTLDKSEQSRIDFVAGSIGGLLDVIYPDAGSTLVIEGSSLAYVGTTLDLKAIKIPLGAVLTDVEWTSSDDKIVFFSNGRLYAIGTGTVTLTAKRGILEAKKTVTVIEGGNIRGINFTSINNTHFIIEDYAAVYNSAIVYWSDDFELRFRVRVYQSFMFEDYIVYINGQEVEPNAEGYYVVPAGSGDAIVTIAGAMISVGGDDGETVTKWSFWEWLLSFFRKIIDFFKGIFGIA